MKIVCYRNFRDVDFWGPAKENIKKLSFDDMDILENFFEECFPDGIYELQLNDFVAYDFDYLWVEILAHKPEED